MRSMAYSIMCRLKTLGKWIYLFDFPPSLQGRYFLRLLVCFPAPESPSEKGCIITERICPQESFSFCCIQKVLCCQIRCTLLALVHRVYISPCTHIRTVQIFEPTHYFNPLILITAAANVLIFFCFVFYRENNTCNFI